MCMYIAILSLLQLSWKDIDPFQAISIQSIVWTRAKAVVEIRGIRMRLILSEIDGGCIRTLVEPSGIP